MSSGGGSSGNKNVTPTTGVDIPPFTSGGGITSEQQSLANYNYGQDLMGNAAAFGNEGLGDSTMLTKADEGAATQRAQQQAQMSDIDTSARYGQYQNQLSNFESNIQNQSTLNEIAQNANNQNQAQLFQGLGNLFGTGTQGTENTPSTSTT